MEMMNNDFKYVLQDMTHLYIGAKYTYEEIREQEDIPFKFRAIICQYIWNDETKKMTMEEHLKTLDRDEMAYMVFKQMKLKVKTTNATIPFEEFIKQRELDGKWQDCFIEEIGLSKLSLMTFSV